MESYKSIPGEPIYGEPLAEQASYQTISLTRVGPRWTRLLDGTTEENAAPKVVMVEKRLPPEKSARPQSLYFASTWARAWARVIDSSILLMIYFYAAMFLPQGPEQIQTGITGETFSLTYELIVGCLVFRWCYMVLFLGFFGATPGKLLFGLKVVSFTESPHELSWDNLLARVLMMDFGFLLLGYTWFVAAFFRRDRRHLIDLTTGTIVVQSLRRPKPKMRWVLGGLFLLYSVSTLPGHVAVYRCLRWNRNGVTIQVPAAPTSLLVMTR